MSAYRVLRGLSYPPGRRAEPGDVVDDIPKGSVQWLRKRGHIEPVPEPDAPPRRSSPAPDSEGGEDR